MNAAAMGALREKAGAADEASYTANATIGQRCRKGPVEQPSVLSPLGALLAELREEPHLRLLAAGRRAPLAESAPGDAETVSSPGSHHRSSPRSPFGALLTDIRDEQRRQRLASGERAPVGMGPWTGRLEPELRLETRVLSQPSRASVKAWLFPSSLGLHAMFVAGAIVLPLFRADVLPEPAAGVRVFFMEPTALPPPPPPPPPPRAPHRAPAPRRTAPPPPTDPGRLAVPVDVPERVTPEEVFDVGVEGGAPGGVEGGIPGGVVGGIVGGISEAPSPPKAVHVGGQIKEPKKLTHVAPVYPDIAIRAKISGDVVLECRISPQGRVVEVKVLRGIPLLNDAAIAAVRQWVYTPTLVDGVPVHVIMPVTVQFTLQDSPARTR